jgi:hypothetical protein
MAPSRDRPPTTALLVTVGERRFIVTVDGDPARVIAAYRTAGLLVRVRRQGGDQDAA